MAKRIFLVLMCALLALSPLTLIGCDDASEQFNSFASQIDNIEKISNENGVETYEITFSDGSYSKVKIENSTPDVTVQSAEIDDAGNLILVMSDNTTKNLGKVIGADGEKGDKGDKGDKGSAGVGIEKIELENGELIVYYTDDTSENLGAIEEQEADNWEYLYYVWCRTYPDYEYSQLEWMAQIVSNALEVELFEVTFDTDGGSEIDSQLVAKGDKVTLPKNPRKTGHTFDGWYVGNEKWSFIGYTVTEAITLKAKWIEGIALEENSAWNGEELNVLVTPYAEEYGIFSQMELSPSTFGESVNKAYNDRQALIFQRYGVTVNWVESAVKQSIGNDLYTANASDTISYEIAIPRAQEVQSLVSKVYDMSSSDYIDLTASYYNQASVEAFTVNDKTLFIGGDYGFNDELVSFVLYYNKDMLATVDEDINLYDEVKNGTWTYDKFLNLAKSVKGDLVDANGETGTYGDEDIYGFSTKDVSRFYHYAGIQEADVDPDTNQYRIALNLDMDKVNGVISNILGVVNGTNWAHTSWGSNTDNQYLAFYQERVLFHEQSISELLSKDYSTLTFDMGIVPFPKYDSESSYHTIGTSAQTTFMCIPKVTKDREMSEFFVNVLCQTGNEYVIAPFKQTLKASMTSNVADENIEILEDYVFPNILCDVGYLTAGWTGFLSNVRTGSYSGGSNTFSDAFLNAEDDAKTTVSSWNSSWLSYWE